MTSRLERFRALRDGVEVTPAIAHPVAKAPVATPEAPTPDPYEAAAWVELEDYLHPQSAHPPTA